MGERLYDALHAKDENVYKEGWKIFHEYEKEIIGNPWQRYYYHDGKIYYYSSDWEGKHCDWSVVYLSSLQSFISKGPSDYITEEDIKKANDWIKEHKKELEEAETEYYLGIAMAALQDLDENSEWKILRNGEEIKKSIPVSKKMTLTPPTSQTNQE